MQQARVSPDEPRPLSTSARSAGSTSPEYPRAGPGSQASATTPGTPPTTPCRRLRIVRFVSSKGPIGPRAVSRLRTQCGAACLRIWMDRRPPGLSRAPVGRDPEAARRRIHPEAPPAVGSSRIYGPRAHRRCCVIMISERSDGRSHGRQSHPSSPFIEVYSGASCGV